MMDFLINNIQWIFSGIGVLGLTILFEFLRKKRRNKSNSNHIDNSKNINLTRSNNNNVQIISNQTKNIYNQENSISEELEISTIDPTKIMEEIQKVSLLSQAKIASQFIGLNIKWDLELFIISEIKDNEVNVLMNPTMRNFPEISFITNTEKYSFLKIAHRGEKFEIIGKIIDCKTTQISLKVEKIKRLN